MNEETMKGSEKSSIAVSHDVRRELMRVQSELQLELSKRVYLNDVIAGLLGRYDHESEWVGALIAKVVYSLLGDVENLEAELRGAAEPHDEGYVERYWKATEELTNKIMKDMQEDAPGAPVNLKEKHPGWWEVQDTGEHQ